MTNRILIILALVAGALRGHAQMIDNTLSFKNINNDKYVRVNYENDFFSATDIYYTQGINIELVAPWVKKLPQTAILFRLPGSYTRYGLTLAHEGYTPTDFSNPAILYGDRPFAACLYLKSFAISTDTVKKYRLSTTLNTGVIGQAAGGMEMQTGIHRVLHDEMPHGWPNQIHNDAILNYQVDFEKQLLSLAKIFLLDADGMARVGTLSDKAGIGATMMMGYFESPFSRATITGNNFRMYAYERPEIDAVGYDATLQGGMFNHTSPYTISAGNISRAVFQNRFGFVVVCRRLYLEYFQSYLSSEFKTGNYHVWGGIQVAVGM